MLCQYYYKTAVHEMDEPNQGQTYTSPQSGRTPPRVKLIQVHKVDRPHQWSNLYKSTKWIDPTRVTNLHKSTKWTDPTKGQDQSMKWTDPTRVKLIQVHKVDGPHQGSNLYKSTNWTDPTKGQNSSPHNGQTQPGSNLFKSIKWTDPTKG